MKDYNVHAYKVYECIQEIRKTIAEHDFQNKSKNYKEQVALNIISELSKSYGLKFGNIEKIYHGKINA